MSSQIALLVSEQRLKQWTNLDQNVRMDDITPSIIQAQDLYIQPLLGTKFYDRLKSGIINSNLTTNENNFLKNYVGPTLLQYAYYILIPQLKYKMVEKGVMSGTSEDATAASLDEIKWIRQDALDKAEFYAKRLIKYLFDEPGMFPEYTNPGTDGMMPNKKIPYFGGLVIPRKYKYKYYEENYCECGNWFPCDICGPAVES